MNAKPPPPPSPPASHTGADLERELAAALASQPPPGAAEPGAPAGGLGPSPDLAPPGLVPRVVDPQVVSRTARKVVQMLDRGFARNLYAAALRTSGGDKEWSAGIVASWVWSEEDLDDVAELVRQTLELYNAAHMLRPDLLLLLAVGTHAAGYVATMASLRQRALEADRLAKAMGAKPPPPGDEKA